MHLGAMTPEELTFDSENLLSAESEARSRRHRIGAYGSVLLGVGLLAAAWVGLGSRARQSQTMSFIEAASEEPCSWEGENCATSKCCRRTEFQCWEKSAAWASCAKTCGDLKQFGGDWTCNVLGGDMGTPPIAPLEDDLPETPSLFCFMVVTPEGVVPPGVKAGYEGQLVEKMKAAKASIFACEGSAIYNGMPATTGEWKSIKNTDIFSNVWDIVKKSGEYLKHGFTVKVDADAVFLPDRLRTKLQYYIKPPPETALYLKNIDFKYKFMGAIELLSQEAVKVLLKGKDQCMKHIGSDGGEDIFMMQCLDALGVGHMDDFSLLKDKYADPGNFNLFDVDACKDDSIVAFHPYKAPNSWMGCYKVATGSVQPCQFTSCEHRWEGEACSLTSELDHPGVHMDPGSGIVAEDCAR